MTKTSEKPHVVVPVEPTELMIEAFLKEIGGSGWLPSEVAEAYCAMIRAAPSASLSQKDQIIARLNDRLKETKDGWRKADDKLRAEQALHRIEVDAFKRRINDLEAEVATMRSILRGG